MPYLLRFAFAWVSGNLRRLKFLTSPLARLLLAVSGGLALAASFPKPGVAGLAWIAPGLLLLAALDRRGARTFRIGYVGGLAFHLASLYWLLYIPFPIGAIAGWLALSAYLALYPAVWVWLCWKLFPAATSGSGDPPNDLLSGPSQNVPTAFRPVLSVTWWQRAVWTLLCAALWVALEIIVGRLFSGFPWLYLGVSQYQMSPLIQIASITGVQGVSFLIVWFSVSLAIVLIRLTELPKSRWTWLAELRVPIVGIALVVVFGLSRVFSLAPSERQLKLALIQPSIAQELIWDHREDANRFAKIMELSRLAVASHDADLLVWPEAAMPAFTPENFRAITNLIATNKVWMVFGADDKERHPTATEPDNYDYFNAAVLCDQEGRIKSVYHKRQLVILGEYVPLVRWFPFLKHLTPIEGGFTSGNGPVPFELAAPSARFSVLICFEDVFPHHVRHDVEDNTDFLLNITNDGWFGRSAAQWQQAANAVFRAIENGVPLVRCTNNGLTCWIDARGRIQQIYKSPDGDVYGAGFMIVRVPLPDNGRKNETTFYRRHGDWFGWGCVMVSALCLARHVMMRRRDRRQGEGRAERLLSAAPEC